jgi:hypothetical protein
MDRRLLQSTITMRETLVDLFELRATSTEYAAPVRQAARQSIDLEIEWDDDGDTGHDWQSSSNDSSPGVSVESWHRARGWCAD